MQVDLVSVLVGIFEEAARKKLRATSFELRADPKDLLSQININKMLKILNFT